MYISEFFFRGFTLCILITQLICLSYAYPSNGQEFEDAIVIDAEPETESRENRQYYEIFETWRNPIVEVGEPPLSPAIDGQCVTNKGNNGKCIPFEKCNPLLSLNGVTGSEDEFDSHANLKEEIYEASKNRNCSSVIFAGESKYGNICCAEATADSVAINSEQHRSPIQMSAKTPFVNSLYADPNNLVDVYAAKSCGESKVGGLKIVNGTQTVAGELPWMVVIFGKSGKQTCGGSLIDENLVMTAAHCIHSYQAHDVSKMRLHIGDWNIRSQNDGQHEVRSIKRIIKHKHFDIDSFKNDIALLRLATPVKFNSHIQPICLPSSGSKNLVGKKLLVAGWGRTSHRGPPSPTLLKVGVTGWDNAACGQTYKGIAPAGILANMICAGDTGLDSCVGDSGGPLMHKEGSKYQQIGIVSFGKGCGTYPGVYTRVSEFLTWISANRNK